MVRCGFWGQDIQGFGNWAEEPTHYLPEEPLKVSEWRLTGKLSSVQQGAPECASRTEAVAGR